ncbi:MAG TPA: dihydrolipoamide dehydrogenase, partial [Rhodospirillales bacterium]|nr:dihydrolipoamide dehydrogenase [Rhodospirillales bacterium]
LIEADRMGGDCLHTGCVPSKSLIAAAAAAQAVREAGRFGIRTAPPEVDFAAVLRHLREVIAAIAPHDSEARFEGLGVTVIRARARFLAPDRLRAGERVVRARRFVIATGSRPAVPPLPGLDALDFLTSDTVFDLAHRPERLLVLGAGPVGCELAQAFRRLGAEVALFDLGPMLPREDPELVAPLRRRLEEEGVTLFEGVTVKRAEPGPALVIESAGEERRITGSHLLVATGRRPAVANLGLERADIAYGPGGIAVDRRMRTTNRRVFAVGDVVADAPRFTHAAAYEAGIVLRNALLRLPARARFELVPRVTYTEPQIAQVGLTEAEADARGFASRAVRIPFADNDRARTEGDGEGMIKLVLGRRGRILGAGLVGRRVDDLLAPVVMALQQGKGASALAALPLPYPTRGEIVKRAAGRYFEPVLFGPAVRRLVRVLGWLG